MTTTTPARLRKANVLDAFALAVVELTEQLQAADPKQRFRAAKLILSYHMTEQRLKASARRTAPQARASGGR